MVVDFNYAAQLSPDTRLLMVDWVCVCVIYKARHSFMNQQSQWPGHLNFSKDCHHLIYPSCSLAWGYCRREGTAAGGTAVQWRRALPHATVTWVFLELVFIVTISQVCYSFKNQEQPEDVTFSLLNGSICFEKL